MRAHGPTIAAALAAFSCGPLAPKRIERRSEPQAFVEARLPLRPNEAAAAIRAAFEKRVPAPGQDDADPRLDRFKLSSRSAPRPDDPGFPEDFQLRANAGDNAALQRYLEAPPAWRTNDFYLSEPTGDYFWFSEYVVNGQPAKFRCSFILHVQPAGDAETRIEIIEYLPQIWVGERLGFPAHGVLPGFYNDQRWVEPTTRDRLRILEAIEVAARGLAPAGAAPGASPRGSVSLARPR